MYFTKKERVVIIIVVCLIVFLSFFKIFKPDNKIDDTVADENNYEEIILEDDSDGKEDTSDSNIDSKIIVHIAGCVEQPGILELDYGARVVDAIEMCGGLTDDANTEPINLARKLNDEEKVYIPRIGEEAISSQGDDSNLAMDGSGLVNLNTASKEELMTLPGIGDKTADKILDYRDKNLFKNIEDLKKVSGIGDKKFEAVKDMIIVN